MTWLANLSFGQAVRWALLWPVFVVIVVVSTAVIALRPAGDWAVGVSLEAGHVTLAWIVATVFALAVIAGPPLIFLALWKSARR